MKTLLLYLCLTTSGCVRVRKTSGDGCISQVVNRVKQVFQLIRATSFGSQEESRFQYFKESVLNQVLRLNQSHTLIVTPSYLSFIRVRNELIRREVRTVVAFSSPLSHPVSFTLSHTSTDMHVIDDLKNDAAISHSNDVLS